MQLQLEKLQKYRMNFDSKVESADVCILPSVAAASSKLSSSRDRFAKGIQQAWTSGYNIIGECLVTTDLSIANCSFCMP